MVLLLRQHAVLNSSHVANYTNCHTIISPFLWTFLSTLVLEIWLDLYYVSVLHPPLKKDDLMY